MSGYFYAYASKATARTSRPDWFEEVEGEVILKAPRVEVSRAGVWITAPEGHDDENGDWVETQAGELSQPYVILSPEDDGPAGKRIAPASHQGFA